MKQHSNAIQRGNVMQRSDEKQRSEVVQSSVGKQVEARQSKLEVGKMLIGYSHKINKQERYKSEVLEDSVNEVTQAVGEVHDDQKMKNSAFWKSPQKHDDQKMKNSAFGKGPQKHNQFISKMHIAKVFSCLVMFILITIFSSGNAYAETRTTYINYSR